jgi:hypothetical protein
MGVTRADRRARPCGHWRKLCNARRGVKTVPDIFLDLAQSMWWRALAASALAALLSSGCGGSATTTSTNIVGPSGLSKCSVTVTASGSRFGADGGSGQLSVDAARECQWGAASNGPWVALKPTTGAGQGTIEFTLSRNDQAGARVATITVNDRRLDLSQDGAPCRIQLSGPANNLPYLGGDGAVSVSTLAGCAWSASTAASWIVLRDPVSGSGNGQVRFQAAPNNGEERVAVIAVSGAAQAIVQRAAPASPQPAPLPPTTPTPSPTPTPGPPSPTPTPPSPEPTPSPTPTPPPCTVELDATQRSVGGGGGDVKVKVRAQSGCRWNASSGVPWITIEGDASGNGNANLQLRVAANPGGIRNGTVAIGTQTINIFQDAAPPAPVTPCVFDVAPTAGRFPSDGGDGLVGVRTTDDCAWTAMSQEPWIAITSSSSGKGSADLRYHVAPNTDRKARSGAMIVAGRQISIAQDAPPEPCTIELDRTDAAIGAGGGDVRVKIRTAGGCAWNASSHAEWISIAGDASGSGNSDIRLRVEPNQGSDRIGTVDVGGAIITIRQEGVSQRQIDLNGKIDKVEGTCPAVTFRVEHRQVQTTADTRYTEGSCEMLREDAKVSVTGLEPSDDEPIIALVVKVQNKD